MPVALGSFDRLPGAHALYFDLVLAIAGIANRESRADTSYIGSNFYSANGCADIHASASSPALAAIVDPNRLQY